MVIMEARKVRNYSLDIRNCPRIRTFLPVAGPDIVAARNLVSFQTFGPYFPARTTESASLIGIAPRAAKHQQTA